MFGGLQKANHKVFWIRALIALFFVLVWPYLFSGGGTLENPAGDGVIARYMRQATNDGPIFGLISIFIVIAGWGIPILLLTTGFKRAKAAMINEPPKGKYSNPYFQIYAGLLIATWIYQIFMAGYLFGGLNQNATTTVNQPLTLEQEIADVVRDSQDNLPIVVDEATILYSIVAQGSRIVRRLTVTGTEGMEGNGLNLDFTKNVANGHCRYEFFSRLMAKGATVEDVYETPDKKAIGSVVTTHADCE